MERGIYGIGGFLSISRALERISLEIWGTGVRFVVLEFTVCGSDLLGLGWFDFVLGVEGSGRGVQDLKRRVCCLRVQPLRQCLQRPNWRFEGSHLGLAVESYSRPQEGDWGDGFCTCYGH